MQVRKGVSAPHDGISTPLPAQSPRGTSLGPRFCRGREASKGSWLQGPTQDRTAKSARSTRGFSAGRRRDALSPEKLHPRPAGAQSCPLLPVAFCA